MRQLLTNYVRHRRHWNTHTLS